MTKEKNCGNCAKYIQHFRHKDCGACRVSHYPDNTESAPSHWEAKPMTNGDRIRAMTDEELARFICNKYTECICPGAYMCNARDGKANGMVKWLKQPVEDE